MEEYEIHKGCPSRLKIDKTRKVVKVIVDMFSPVEKIMLTTPGGVVCRDASILRLNFVEPTTWSSLSLKCEGGPSVNRAAVNITYEPEKNATKWVVQDQDFDEIKVLGVFEARQAAIDHVRGVIAATFAEIENDDDAYQEWLRDRDESSEPPLGTREASMRDTYAAERARDLGEAMSAWGLESDEAFEWGIHRFVLTETPHYT